MVKSTRRAALLIAIAVILASPADAKKSKAPDPNVVDSGSFGIFKSGKRIATETFKIEQSPTESVTHSEIKADNGSGETTQSSELHLAANGDIVKYDWRQTKPEKQESTLFVGDQVLTQRIVTGADNKTQEIPYILPASTSVLDDYFFVHREVITWKYVGSQCADLSKCQLPKQSIGIIVPRQHTSGVISMEYKGLGKTDWHGKDTDLNLFLLHADTADWSLYFDHDNKLVKVEVPSQQVEAIRD